MSVEQKSGLEAMPTDEASARQRSFLASLIKRQISLLQSLELAEQEDDLRKLESRILSDGFRIAVIGGFRRGKSTIINALLRQEVLPPVHTPILSEVKWGETRRAIIHYADSSKEIAVDQIEKFFIEASLSTKNRPERLEQLYPLELCRSGIEFVEIPDPDQPAMAQVLKKALMQADATIFTLSCEALGSQSEISLIDNLVMAAGHEEILFACNRFDSVRDDESDMIKQFAGSLLEPRTRRGSEHIFFISAWDALKSGRGDEGEMQSDFKQLEAAAASMANHHKWRLKFTRAAKLLRGTIELAHCKIKEGESALHKELKTAGDRITELEKMPALLASERRELMSHISSAANSTRSLVADMASNFLRDIAGKIEGWIAEYEIKQQGRLAAAVSQAQAHNLARQLTEFISRKIENEFAAWQRTELALILAGRLDHFKQDLEASLNELARHLVELKEAGSSGFGEDVTLKFVLENGDGDERAILYNVDFSIDPASAAQGTAIGSSQILGALISGTLGIVTTKVIGLNTLVMFPLLIGGFLAYAYLSVDNSSRKLKQNIGKAYADQIRASSIERGKLIADLFARRQAEIGNRIDRQIGGLIDDQQRRIGLIVSEHQKTKSNLARMIERLEATKNELSAITNDLNNFMAKMASA